MKSDLPKVLHPVDGKPMITTVLDTLTSVDIDKIIVVIGYKGELVEEAVKDYPVTCVWQHEQKGTGHAVMVTEDALGDFDGNTLIALGDVPFLQAGTINRLFDTMESENTKAACLSAIVAEPKGYGRVVRDDDQRFLKAIVEAKDASDEILKLNEINTGTFCFDNKTLFDSLKKINNENAQKEYYLTDCVKVLYDNDMPVSVMVVDDPDEGEGINSVEQLNTLVAKFHKKR